MIFKHHPHIHGEQPLLKTETRRHRSPGAARGIHPALEVGSSLCLCWLLSPVTLGLIFKKKSCDNHVLYQETYLAYPFLGVTLGVSRARRGRFSTLASWRDLAPGPGAAWEPLPEASPAGTAALSPAQRPISAHFPNKRPELVPQGTERSYLHLLSKHRGHYKTAHDNGQCTFHRRSWCAAWTWHLEASSSWPCSSPWGSVSWWGPRNLVSDRP